MGIQWGGCIPWQRFLNYHLVKVSGKFCLKITGVEQCRILAVTFLFCGRRFRGACCSILMMLEKLMTILLRSVWNLSQNLVSDFLFLEERELKPILQLLCTPNYKIILTNVWNELQIFPFTKPAHLSLFRAKYPLFHQKVSLLYHITSIFIISTFQWV